MMNKQLPLNQLSTEISNYLFSWTVYYPHLLLVYLINNEKIPDINILTSLTNREWITLMQ